jgi:hypothetical protein
MATLLVFSSCLQASETQPTDFKEITIENSLFNSLIGNWRIEDETLSANGQWLAGQGADWNWYKILDGNAIQDDWIAPSMSTKVEKGKRQFGTNIRIYNPEKGLWEMAWIASTGKKLDTFTAVEDSEKIVMSGFYAGADSKITFFNINNKSFEWKLELQQADKSWLEVYRIKGSKISK